MHTQTVLITLGVLVVVLLGGIIWLARTDIHPPVQQTHLVLPDDRIPHA